MVAKCNTGKCSSCACDAQVSSEENTPDVFETLMVEVQELKQLLKQYKAYIDELENENRSLS